MVRLSLALGFVLAAALGMAEVPVGPIRFLGNQNLAPVVFSRAGAPDGLVVGLVKAMAPALPRPVEIQVMDWQEAQARVSRGEADVLVQINWTKERDSLYDFSEPLLESRFSVFVRENTLGIAGVASLRGTRVGVEKGGLPQKVLSAEGQIALSVIPNFDTGFRWLSEGKIDAVVVDTRVGTYALAQSGIRNIRISGEPLVTSFSAFAVRKGNLELLNQINQALRTIRANGLYQRVLDDWSPEEVVFETRDQLAQRTLLTLTVFFSVVLLLAAGWVFTLRRELGRRRAAEREVKRQWETLSGIIDSTAGLVFSLDLDYRYRSFNSAQAALIHDLSRKTIAVGDRFLDFLPDPRDREVCQHHFDRALAGESLAIPLQFEGGSRSFQAFASPQRSAAGDIVGLAVFAFDWTDRDRAAERLRQSERRYRTLLETLTSYIYTVQVVDGKPVSTIHGPGCLAVTGYTPEDYLDDPALWYRMIWEADRDRVMDHVACILQGVEVPPIDHRIVHPDGSLRWIRNTCVSHRNEEGALTSYDGLIVDITAEKRSEEALQRADRLESIGSLAGGIAHDFNNLLGGIFGYIQLAKGQGQDNPAVVKYLEKAEAVFQRAKALTHQLLTFTKKNVPKTEVHDLPPLLEKSAGFTLAGTATSLETDWPPNLWPVTVDENQIGQVFDNLILNGHQAQTAGGCLHLTARNRLVAAGEVPPLPEGPYVEVSVRDEGEGIPDHLLERIFDPFFTTKASGHGLGLATAHSIVTKHGGALQVESTVGRGSTFRVFLPASLDLAAVGAEGSEVHHRGTGSILLMDDEPALREILGTLLRGLGYSVVEASDGSEAVRKFRQRTGWTAAILDLTIRHGLGGQETLPRLRDLQADLPVFAISGFAEDPVLARPAEFGFTGSLSKPFRPAELERLLESHLPR